jgi:enoyl-CoA hydratase/carnithine racemase
LQNRVVDASDAMPFGLLTHLVEDGGFESAVQEIAQGIRDLDTASVARLLANTRDDMRDAELAELVRSLSASGLRERIANYRNASSA